MFHKLSKRSIKMKINQFAVRIAEEKGKKLKVNIAQIKEILAIINEFTSGVLYVLIKTI